MTEPDLAMNPLLVTRAGLARRWGVSRARIAELITKDGFPAPVQGVRGENYAFYDVVKCERWRKQHPFS
jgi:hypothetical protein